VRRLWPDPADDVDVAALVAAEARPPWPDRPWLAVNMIASVDGATSIGGRSGALGGPADRTVFAALRAVADVVLAGAGTVRAEQYGPARPSLEQRAERRARGQDEAPRIAVVTASMSLDLGAPLFTAGGPRPILLTCDASPADRRDAASAVADVVVIGDDRVDLREALRVLALVGTATVLAEGGPHLNGALVRAGLVDEWNVTISPVLAAGEGGSAAAGPPPERIERLRLDRVLEGDDLLFLRHVRA
jgi:riboflavin biosynthesis pyrimidine reductase